MASFDPDFDPQQQPAKEKHLLEYVDVVMRRWRLVLAVFVAVTSFATVRTFLARSVYQGRVEILLGESPNVLSFREVAEVGARRKDFYQTQYRLMQSRVLARRVIEELNLLQDVEYGGPRTEHQVAAAIAAPPGESPLLEGVTDRFLSKLNIIEIKDSQLVSIAFESYRPSLAARVANELATKFIQQTLEFRFQTSSEATDWLGVQLKTQEARVAEADAALQEIKQREGIINIEEQRMLVDQKLMQLGSALNNLTTQRLEKRALYLQMIATANPQELPAVMTSGVVQNMRVELQTLQSTEAELLGRYLEQHPELQLVRSKIAETTLKIDAEVRRILRAAENDFKATLAQEESVRKALHAVEAEKLTLSRSAVDYDAKLRELEASRAVLDSLSARHKQTDVARELNASSIRIVDPAVSPRRPIRPNRALDITLGMLVGFALGVGLAFFLEYMDNTVRTPEDIKDHLGVPLLGVIAEHPSESGDAPLVTAHLVGSFAEGYRVLRTAIDYSWTEKKPRVIVVSSTSPGEGKTLTSINLASTLAAEGPKTLLIDADLRKPQVGRHLELPLKPGLGDVLVGESTVEEAAHTIATGLAVLTAGSEVPSPADLMTTPTLAAVFEQLRCEYQYIVVDTPPIGAVADALILAGSADGVVVVTGAEMVPRKAVAHTLERLAESGARVLGVVLNRAQLRRGSSSYYGRYYGQYEARETISAAVGTGAGKVASFRGRASG